MRKLWLHPLGQVGGYVAYKYATLDTLSSAPIGVTESIPSGVAYYFTSYTVSDASPTVPSIPHGIAAPPRTAAPIWAGAGGLYQTLVASVCTSLDGVVPPERAPTLHRSPLVTRLRVITDYPNHNIARSAPTSNPPPPGFLPAFLSANGG